MQVVIILGYANNRRGKLHTITLERIARAASLDQPDIKYLATGGFGKRFNKASKPHYRYLLDKLALKGIPAGRILGGVPSSSTAQDASMSAQLLAKYSMAEPIDKITVITSDFHRPRAQWLFEQVFKSVPLEFVESHPTNPWTRFLAKILDWRERRYLERLKKEAKSE